MQKVPCTKEGEIIAYSDGSSPSFNLIDNANYRGGIIIKHLGALSYSADQFGCGSGGATDPSSGLPPLRSLTLRILCDSNATTPTTPYFYESSTCQYTVWMSSMYACGQLFQNTSNSSGCNTPGEAAASSAAASSSAAVAYGVGGLAGGIVCGVLLGLLVANYFLGRSGRGSSDEEGGEVLPLLKSSPKFLTQSKANPNSQPLASA